jgi:acetolactate synthase-1/2/3 large subunit
MGNQLTGAEIVFKALQEHGVEYIFGYPGGAVLPMYDQISKQDKIKHILVRHEQGAGHAAEGYARSTGKPGVVLVTSGPGATNMVTALTDAYMDSIPLVCITGQVPTHLIGTDAFQECDTTGITRPCTKHNWLVKDVNQLAEITHKAFHIATSGRPGPVLIDIPKDIQFQKGEYKPSSIIEIDTYKPNTKAKTSEIEKAVELIVNAKKPVIYSGGGVINAGEKASNALTEFTRITNFPITSTLQGLGAFPGSDHQFLGMLGMHGTYEANNAMHECDLMINIGARFDDRITGRVDAFSPNSKKIHIDIDPSSINKIVKVDVAIVGDCLSVINDMLGEIKNKHQKFLSSNKENISDWWKQIDQWREKKSLSYKKDETLIMPQYAVERLYELTKNQDTFITTEVGQHQMWAAQFYKFDKPNRWMTSGGLGLWAMVCQQQ